MKPRRLNHEYSALPLDQGACYRVGMDTLLYSLQFTVCSLQFTVYSLQFTVCSLQFTVYSSEMLNFLFLFFPGLTKGFDLNVTDSVIDDNSGRGIWVLFVNI